MVHLEVQRLYDTKKNKEVKDLKVEEAEFKGARRFLWGIKEMFKWWTFWFSFLLIMYAYGWGVCSTYSEYFIKDLNV